jgi:amino acid permease
MVGITGSTGAAAITFVFPGLFYYVTHADQPGPLRTAAFVLFIFGCVIIPVSLFLTLAGY